MKWALACAAMLLLTGLPAPLEARTDTLSATATPRPAPQVMRRIATVQEPDTVHGMGVCSRIAPGEVQLFAVTVRCLEGGGFTSENQSWDVHTFVFTGAGAHASNRACTDQTMVDDNEFTDASCELLWELRRQAFQAFVQRASEDGAPVRFFAVRHRARGGVFEIMSYRRAD